MAVDLENEWFAGKRVLITGAAGFIGHRIVAKLLTSRCQIVRAVRSPRASLDSMAVSDVVGDVSSEAFWNQIADGVDVVFHLAGQTSTYEANRNPGSDLQYNVLPVLLLFQSFRTRGIRPVVILASTATICGIPQELPVTERYLDCPLTIYDLHKQMAEQYLEYHVREGAAAGAALRLANVYGPGPKSSRSDRGILNQMVRRAAAGESLTVYGAGEQIRDYVHVDDVARAFLLAAIHAGALKGSHFLIGSGRGYTIAQALRTVADRAERRYGKPVTIRSVEPPENLSPIEARNFVADTSVFSSVTGWSPRYELAAGIDSILDNLP